MLRFSVVVGLLVVAVSGDIRRVPRDACSEPGGVQNLIRSGSMVYWDPPADVALCPIEYRIVYEDNFRTENQIVTDTHYDFQLISCVTIRISVTAIVRGVESEVTTSLAFRVPIVSDIPPPTSVGIIPSSRSADTYWRASPSVEHACPITSILVIVRSGNGPSLQNVRIDVEDSESRLFRVHIDNLNPNTDYQLLGVLYSDHNGSQMSDEASFTTSS